MSISNSLSVFRSFSKKQYIVIVCFFLSGCASLIYEMCWIRKSTLLYGSDLYATSTIIAVFFAGLALGSFIAGKWMGTIQKPLRAYARIELSVGIVAALNPFLFSISDSLFSTIYPLIDHNFYLLVAVRFLFISCVILPPTILLGTTFPLIARYCITHDQTLSFFIPSLYAINTLGALVGSLLSGFLLIKTIGFTYTIECGALINCVIGFTILAMRIDSESVIFHDTQKIARPLQKKKSQILTESIPRKTYFLVFGGLFFTSGFLALGYEIVLSRYLTLLLHSTIYTSILTISLTLAGISVGSFIAIGLLQNSIAPHRLFMNSQIISGLVLAFILQLPARVWATLLDTDKLLVQVVIISAIFFLPSILSGISFPSALRIVASSHSAAARRIGLFSAINTGGGILGSLTIAFFLLPSLGLQNLIMSTTLVSIGIGIITLFYFEKSMKLRSKMIIAFLSAGIWFIPFQVMKTNIPADYLGSKEKLIEYKEGLNSNLAIVTKESGVPTLEIDRLWQGQKDATHQRMASYIPLLCHPEPKDVLVVGVGAGQIVECFSQYPFKTITCVDIEKDLSYFIRKYFYAQWIDDPRTMFVIDDGRNFIKHTSKKYDIVSIEVGQAFRPNLVAFYTEDFYTQVRSKLNHDGIVCQFVPIIFFTLDQYKSLLATFIKIFPESILFYNYYEFIIIGTCGQKLSIDAERFKKVQEIPRIYDDLDYSYWGGPQYSLVKMENFLGNLLMGPPELKKFIGNNNRIYTDDKPELEYQIALYQNYSILLMNKILNEVKAHIADPLVYLKNSTDSIASSVINEIRELNLNNIIAAEYCEKYAENSTVIDPLLQAYSLNPKNLSVLYELGSYYASKNDLKNSIKFSEEIVAINPTDTNAIKFLAFAYMTDSDFDKALVWYNKLLTMDPDVDTYINAGNLFAQKGNYSKALELYRTAMHLDPKNLDARKNYELMQKMTAK